MTVSAFVKKNKKNMKKKHFPVGAEFPGIGAEFPGIGAECPGISFEAFFLSHNHRIYTVTFGFMEGSSRTFSSSTLIRGCELTRTMSMGLENDSQYQAMMDEKKKLEVT